ncbi:myristylated membrane protein [Pelophylax esculentus virus]|uniref:Myristylated membrane protein n=1 Tax=Pelophylax esculentus virus TaxID=2023775 RepID=A0A222NTE9_9VIRU|nr:myristylated membrane protein [Pelophylax esculentus virus]
MSIIGATRLQNDKSDTYSAGPCYAGGCSAFTPRGTCGKDWDLGEQTCASGFCTSQPLCARIKKTQVCGLRYSSKGKDPLVSAEWDSRGAPYVRCTYDADLIDTQAQVDQFVSMFGESPGLAERYCMRGVKNTAGELVSRVSSDADPAGGWCRKWYSAHRGPDQDAALGSFCIKNPGAADCKCINRASDPVYQKVKTLHAYPDQCWYVPCAADIGELKMGTQRDTPTNCPTQVCQIVFNMLDDGSVTMDDVKNTINCDFSKYVPPPPPPKPTPPKPTPLTPSKPTHPKPTPLTPSKPTPPKPTPLTPSKPTPTPPTPRPVPNRKIMFFVAGAVLVAILISTVRW